LKILLLLICFFISFSQAENLEKVSLQLKWKYQFQFAGFIIAKEKGFYKDVGLDVEILEYTDKTDTLSEMKAGKTTFGVSDSALILESLKGLPVVAMMAVYQTSPYILMGLKSSNLNTLSKLNGKKIAIYDDINGQAIESMLKIHNINYIKTSITDKLNRLKRKEIDVAISYISNEPYLAKEMGMDVSILNPSDYGFERYGDILFTLQETIDNNPKLVENMYKASKKGFEYAFTHIDEVVDIIYKRYNSQNKSKEALLNEAYILKNMAGLGQNFGELNQSKVDSIAYIYSYSGTVKYDKNNLLNFIYHPKEKDKKINLTIEEENYLKKHKTITIHNETNWAPYNYIKNGKAEGFSIEYIKLLAEKLNIDIEFIQGHSWREFLDLVKDEKIDVIANIAKNTKREKYINFTTPYIQSKKAIFSNLPSIKNISDLSGKTVAIPDQFYTQDYLSKNYPNIKLKIYKDTTESIYAVINKEADAIIENFAVVSSLMKKNGLDIPYVTLSDDKELITSLHIGVSKSQIVLRDILEKAKASITEEEFRKLEHKWFGVDEKNKNMFTQDELNYINNNPKINVCYHKDQHPWIMNIKDKMQGSSVEFLKYITKKSNLQFSMIETETVSEHFQKIKDGQCDVAPIIVTKPNIFEFINPTDSMIEDNIVLVTKINEHYVSDFNEIGDKKIAIHRGKKNLIKYVKSIYPNMKLTKVDNIDLDRVVSDEFYGYISTSYKMSYKIYPNYVNKIKIMSKIGDKKIQGSFGITVREPLLLSIFNKSLNDISELERQEIENAWVSVEIEKQFDYTLFLQLISVFIVVFLILIISNVKQKKLKEKIQILNENLEESIKVEVQKNREKDKLMLSQSRLAQMGEVISMIAHQWRQPLNSLSLLNQTILLKYDRDKLNDEAIEFFRTHSKKQIHEMSKTIDDFKDFFKPQKVKKEFLLNEVIDHLFDIVKPIYSRSNITININIDQEHYIMGYKNELGQAVLNILNNAKDALVEKDIENKVVNITIKANEGKINIVISDNAGGISDEYKENIFDPYFSTKGDKNGTGLGLYMTKMIVEDHMDGKITVQNNHIGAVFTIILETQSITEDKKNNVSK